MYRYFHENFVSSLIFSLDKRDELIDDIQEQLENADTTIVRGEINAQKFKDGEVCVDYDKLRLLTSIKVAYHNRGTFKEMGLVPAKVLEYPTKDQLEIEIDFY